ncbi:general transcription factor II-I repeat domain-containing protein 2A-like isoform X2 [Periplaneta americana]|uniref:general transcription factor II-I repeat domain-containing protein 2A-like isoform X2 n=1 Tax=Periplaneta americana TaxID=6978 RepID=UPI0037E81F19
MQIRQWSERSMQDDEILNNEPAVRLSYRVSLQIAHKLRSSSDGDFIKEFLKMAAKELCPNVVKQFESVKLSRWTVNRRIQDLSEDLQNQLAELCRNFIAYSLALYETTDVSDSAQLAIFIRGVDEYLQITEELLDVVPVEGTTTGSDILACIEECVDNFGLRWDLLVSVATDGSPAVIGGRNGLVGLLNEKFKIFNLGARCVYTHCILHQENLCANIVSFNNVMSVVVETINFIRCVGLNHRQFKTLFVDLDSQYGEMPYYCEIRWLSRGAVLDRYFELREDIAQFMESKDKAKPELRNKKWVCDLAFMAEVTGYLNEFNTSLQEKGQVVSQLYDKVRAFKLKLQLWGRQLRAKNTAHFQKLASINHLVEESNFEEYARVTEILHEEFETRFKDLEALETEFKIFVTPYSTNVDVMSPEIQLELIDLQCDRELKDRFNTKKHLSEFYKHFSRDRFPRLHNHAGKMLSMFGSTYLCEQLFSAIKVRKSGNRSSLSDLNLKCALRIHLAQNIAPNIEKLVVKKCSL